MKGFFLFGGEGAFTFLCGISSAFMKCLFLLPLSLSSLFNAAHKNKGKPDPGTGPSPESALPFALQELRTADGLAKLDAHLDERSYVLGFEPSHLDTAALAEVSAGKDKSLEQWDNVRRWRAHIQSFGEAAKKFPVPSCGV